MKRNHLNDMVCCKDLQGVLVTPEVYDWGGKRILIKLGKKYREMKYCVFCGSRQKHE